MAYVSDSIPNLIGGVSQQAAKLRLATQCQDQVNCDASIVEGLGKRPPTMHAKRLTPYGGGFTQLQAKDAAVHTISRDLAERYQVIVYPGVIRVFDLLDGSEKTVLTPHGTSYINVAQPRVNVSFTTVQDLTLVTNKLTLPQMLSAPADSRGVEALVFVRVANYQTDYILVVDGFMAKVTTTTFGYDATNTGYGPVGGSFTSDLGGLPVGTSGSPATISTEAISQVLRAHLANHHTNAADYEFTVARSLIWIRRDNAADFVISYTDSRGNTQMSLAKERVQRLSDLPAVAPHGFQVEVTGDPSTVEDNYYAQFEQLSPALAIGEGLWKEIAKPGIPVAINPATMPHILVRNGDGTFTFSQGTWGQRVAGDLNTAPEPAFIGRGINGAFLLRNRLGFVAGASAPLSRARKIFEFFNASATALTDADPINEFASHTKAVTLRHAVPFKKRLFFFADEAQFELQYGGTTLSNDTAEIVPVWEYKAGAAAARPVGAGKSLFFPIVRDANFAGIMEAVIEEGTAPLADAGEVTAHVPSYVPQPIRKLAVSPNENTLLVLSDAAPRSLWAYRSHWAGDQKVLSSWSRWDYFNEDPNAGIVNIDFIDDVCVMLAYRADGLYLQRFSVAPKQHDPDWTHQFKLDQRADETACVVVYEPVINQTLITAPYPLPEKFRVVARFPDNHSKKPGAVAQILNQVGSTVLVAGDWSAAKFYIGERYTSTYDFSPQFLRKPASGGGQEIVGTGRLQMLFWTLHFADTGEFEVHVTPHKAGTTFVQPVSGHTLGAPEAVIGSVPIVSGAQRVGIQGKNTEAAVRVFSDSHLPFHVLSVDWEANYVAHSRRLSARRRGGRVRRMVADRKGK